MTTLHDPLTLACGQVLPNRLLKAALSEGLATHHGAPDARLQRLYARWGDGGYGLVVTGNVMVDRGHLGEPGNVVVEDDRDLQALTRWAKTSQDGGSPIWMQLNHPGRQGNGLITRRQPVAPSAVASGVPGMPVPRALADDEIEDLVDRFATAAAVAESAGFDGVQIHAAHGYLISQFLSPRANLRTDRWGGDAERRRAFLLAVIARIRQRVSPAFAVGVKLNSADFQRGGFAEDESSAVVAALATADVDLLEISGGSYVSPAMMGRGGRTPAASTRAREAYFLEFAESVRSVAAGLPLAVTGGFRSRAAMSAAIGSGGCDMVGLGRPAILRPGAGADLLTAEVAVVPTASITLAVPRSLAGTARVRSFEGALDLFWHTDQMHRLADGLDPDPSRSRTRTMIAAVRRNGLDAFAAPRRGTARDSRSAAVRATHAGGGARKFRFERLVGRYLANPAMRGLDRIGVRSPMVGQIETTGRRTGLVRRVPVAVSVDRDGAWIIAQHGVRSGWASNLVADPRVRLKLGRSWRDGSAVLVPEDDVVARGRSFARNPLLGSAAAATFRAMQTRPVSVRVTFTDRP